MLGFGGRLGGVEERRVGIGPEDLFVLGDDGSSDDFVLEVDFIFVVFVDHGLEKFRDVVGVEGRALSGHSGGEVEVADDFDSVVADDFSFLSQFAVASVFCSQVHNNAAWFHQFDHLFRNQFRGWFAWNQSRGDDNVYLLALFGEQFHFRLDEFLAHFFCVPTDPCATLTETFHL